MIAEMRARLKAGASVVVAKDGVIVAVETGRGIRPLLKLFDERMLDGAVVVDKVIGRAAAAICAEGGAVRVFAELAGEGAAELLAARGIEFEAELTVKTILNHAQDDSCPMEKAVKSLDDPKQMIAAVRRIASACFDML